MKSKKGVLITVIILGIITVASFLVWVIPEKNEMSFVISDFELHLDEVKMIHLTISKSVEEDLDNVMNGAITPQKYVERAQTSSSQINAQIIKLVESRATNEWYESYLEYIESLRAYNSYIRETLVIADSMKKGNDDNIEEMLNYANSFKDKSQKLAISSDELRP